MASPDYLDSNESVKEFIERYLAVRELGWVRSHRSNNTGIGKTLEDLLMIDENNLAEADIGDVEIKSQRALASSKVSLFTKKPTGPNGANNILRDQYGVRNPKHPDLMQMHASMFNYWNQTYRKWGMRLRTNDEEERIYLDIKDLQTDEIEQFTCWYDYDVIRQIIAKKMNILAFVSADSRTGVDGGEEFRFTECKLFYGGTFERFLALMNAGKIQYDVRIGSYKTPGKNYGKVHDHGSGFRIAKSHMGELFSGFEKL
jgi:hypothetical protein